MQSVICTFARCILFAEPFDLLPQARFILFAELFDPLPQARRIPSPEPFDLLPQAHRILFANPSAPALSFICTRTQIHPQSHRNQRKESLLLQGGNHP